MNILFVIDRLELKYFEYNRLVTNFELIKGFLDRKHNVAIATIDMLKVKSSVGYADFYESYTDDKDIYINKSEKKESKIEEFDLVMFRPDPPVDLDYINATYVFDFVDKKKTLVLNNPTAVRNFNEKLHAVMFNDLMPRNIVTSTREDILKFLDEEGQIILKPLNQCFGGGVMFLEKGDKNTSVIINNMTNSGTKMIMVQSYIKEAEFGDKRVLFLGDKVLPYCVQKVPSNNDFKFCEHDDSNIKKAVLTEEEYSKFQKVAKRLNAMCLPMVGLDVIDGKIIEINVTCPCYFIREINNHFKCHVENEIINYIEDKVREFKSELVTC